MVAANISAMWLMKMLYAPALVAISWIRITNLVYPMVRMTYKATTVHSEKNLIIHFFLKYFIQMHPKNAKKKKKIFHFFQRPSNVAALS